MAYEEAPYNLVHSTDTYEIRHYKDRLVVEVVNKNDDNSFRKLFRYISGQNNKSEEIIYADWYLITSCIKFNNETYGA